MSNSLKQLEKIKDLTTIVRLQRKEGEIIFGDPDARSRFEKNQGEQIYLTELVECWQRKYNSFNGKWNVNRQNYRFLYDAFELFYYSFQQLRINKINSINTYSKQEIIFCDQLMGADVFSVYSYGKKCIDIIEKLSLLEDCKDNPDQAWLKKFKQT